MQPRKVLIVDDSKVVHAILGTVLKRYEGVEIVDAYNGDEALEILEKDDSFDVIFLDLNMPVLDGIAFLKIAGERGILSKIPVIICSEADEETIKESLKLGGKALLRKPFKNVQVYEVVEKVLSSFSSSLPSR